jgi:hypothetical protein
VDGDAWGCGGWSEGWGLREACHTPCLPDASHLLSVTVRDAGVGHGVPVVPVRLNLDEQRTIARRAVLPHPLEALTGWRRGKGVGVEAAKEKEGI